MVWLSGKFLAQYLDNLELMLIPFLSWGNLNGILSSNIYTSEDAPRFIIGHSVIIAWLAVFLFGGSLATTLLLRIENRRRIKGQRNSLIEGKSTAEIEFLGDMK